MKQDSLSPLDRDRLIHSLASAPLDLREAVLGLSPEKLKTPYRSGGWSVRQVVHHLSDSHMNGYIRFKLALTEEHPTIKTYDQDRWAALADSEETPLEVSLGLLDSLHRRWAVLLLSMEPSDFQRTFQHPEIGIVPLDKQLALYEWHGRHHIAQITALIEKMKWR